MLRRLSQHCPVKSDVPRPGIMDGLVWMEGCLKTIVRAFEKPGVKDQENSSGGKNLRLDIRPTWRVIV